MTLATELTKVQYNGNGSTVAFAFAGKFPTNADLVVVLTSAAGVDTTKTLTTHYTVTGAGAAGGGTVTMLTAPATGEVLTIYRDINLTQSTDLTNQGAYFAASIETALDRVMMVTQQLKEIVNRAIRIGITSQEALPSFSDVTDTLDAAVVEAETAVTNAEAAQAAAEAAQAAVSAIVDGVIGESYETVTVGSQTDYILPFGVSGSYVNLGVYVSGVKQRRSTYTVLPDTITVRFGAAFTAGLDIEFIAYDLLDALPSLPINEGLLADGEAGRVLRQSDLVLGGDGAKALTAYFTGIFNGDTITIADLDKGDDLTGFALSSDGKQVTIKHEALSGAVVAVAGAHITRQYNSLLNHLSVQVSQDDITINFRGQFGNLRDITTDVIEGVAAAIIVRILYITSE